MRFLAKFFRRWYLYLLPMILLPVLAMAYGKQALTVYESSALVYINNPSAIGSSTTTFSQYLSPAQNGANAMNEALLSETFVVSVAQATDLAGVYNLSSQYGQDAVTERIRAETLIAANSVGQNTLTVTVDDPNPHMAQQLADALVKQFTSFFTQGQQTLDQKQIAFLQQELDDANAKVQQDQAHITEYLQQHPNTLPSQQTDPTLATQQQQLSTDNAQVASLTRQISTIKFDLAAAQNGVSNVFRVEDAPRLPLTSTLHLKKLIVYPIGGLGAALALVILIVGVQTMTDRRVYSKDDLRTITENLEIDIPTIEAVPLLRSLSRRHDPDDDASESGISGVLVPVLTVLPQLGTVQISRELRRAVGVLEEDDE